MLSVITKLPALYVYLNRFRKVDNNEGRSNVEHRNDETFLYDFAQPSLSQDCNILG